VSVAAQPPAVPRRLRAGQLPLQCSTARLGCVEPGAQIRRYVLQLQEAGARLVRHLHLRLELPRLRRLGGSDRSGYPHVALCPALALSSRSARRQRLEP
jgi:hypothetical protein